MLYNQKKKRAKLKGLDIAPVSCVSIILLPIVACSYRLIANSVIFRLMILHFIKTF